ncbi:mitotic checkpoint serine/threonine-protein kinase BUB1-like isoform X2 [Limulus polyphemus]|uniref:Mitotic checkpoint serine/threonine-protein kinase BUB1-like isoform X2 n=1 Tax=Limulus polyphemus TaxID=6850 RepID=A0ABM1SEC4_LIMPO|nr:mitotic checkpoint serine/threonine-protein kinase BUB1-like isoform X2 [Limulus polyphemus]
MIFEAELRTYQGDDPLDIWYRYVKWIEQNYPKGGYDANLPLLVERCLSVFKDANHYYNDKRFVEIWLKYVNQCDNKLELYNFMFTHKIGCKLAVFYENWAYQLELQENFRRADSVLTEGIQSGADPQETLLSAQKQLQMKIGKLIMEGVETNDMDNFGTEVERTALGALRPKGKKQTVGVNRVGPARIDHVDGLPGQERNPSVLSKNNGVAKKPFKVYNDENDVAVCDLPLKTKSSCHFTKHSEASKENEKKPGKWTKAKLPQKTTSTVPFSSLGAVQPPFIVHEDEDVSQPTITPRKLPPGSHVLSAKKCLDSPPVAIFEPPDPTKIPKYDKMKVYGGGREFQFEEIRAAKYFAKKKEQQEKEKTKKLEEQVLLLQEEMKKMWNCFQGGKQTERGDSEPSKDLKDHNVQCATGENASLFSVPKLCSGSSSSSSVDCVTTVLASVPNSTETTTTTSQSLDIGGSSTQPHEPSSHECSSSTGPAVLGSRGSSYCGTPTANMQQAISEAWDLWNGTLSRSNNQSVVGMLRFGGDTNNAAIKSTVEPLFSVYQDPTQTVQVLASSGLSEKQQYSVHEDQSVPPVSNVVSSTSSKPPSDVFSVYQDPIQSIPPEVNDDIPSNTCEKTLVTAPHGSWQFPDYNEMDKDNLENIPPPDYVQNNAERSLTGILKPSINIPFKPLDEEEEDELDGIEPLENDNDFQDENVTFASMKTADLTNKISQYASTPFSLGRAPPLFTDDITTSLAKLAVQPQETKKKIELPMKPPLPVIPAPSTSTANEIQENCNQGDLSPIMECSREFCSSKSSTSSSSGCSTTFGSTYHNSRYHLSSLHKSRNDHQSKINLARPTVSNITASKRQAQDTVQVDIKPPSGSLENTVLPDEQIKFVQVDPYDPKLQEQLLQEVDPPLAMRRGYVAKNEKLPILLSDAPLNLGMNTYHVTKQCAMGAYARIFKAVLLGCDSDDVYDLREDEFTSSSSNPKTAALKVSKPSCEWEFYICTELESRLGKHVGVPDVRSSVMTINTAMFFTNGSIFVNDFCKYGTLLDLTNFYKKQGQTVPESLVMYLTLEMLLIMDQVHRSNIVHGDVKPDNFMVLDFNKVQHQLEETSLRKTTALRIIDFGRGIDLNLFPPGTTFTIRVNTEGFQCVEMKENRPWTFQTDWYGVLGSVHTLLFGEYMNVQKAKNGVWSIIKKFKRYWQTDLWEELFTTFLNIPSCDKIPSIDPFVESILRKLSEPSRRTELLFKLQQFTCLWEG